MYKSVADCYNKQSVFITGGTEFLGKVLLEKLLYSCPGLEKAYVLVRDKNNASSQQRLQKMIELPLFSRLRNQRPQVFEKIVPIVGDITAPKLGLREADEELLCNKVSLLFHVAATVKFDGPLDVAMDINVRGTERVIDLSQRMKNIKSFLYVSTAYSNTNRDVIEEVLYPPPASLDEVKKILNSGITERQTKKVVNDRPNTYTFSKALAENVVAKNHTKIPSVIICPSAVVCCKEPPVVGWIDAWMAGSSTINGANKGWNRVTHGDPNNIVDLIPVDYVSNLMIVATTKTE